MEAILFGSIGTLVETSEVQRKCFNRAFKEFGLDWYWNIGTYCRLISEPGGMKRIQNYNGNILSQLEIAKIHDLKESFFLELIPKNIYLRPSVEKTIDYALKKKLKLGLVTTTSKRNIDLIGNKLKSKINLDVFDLVSTSDDVKKPKPNSEVYNFAVSKLNIQKNEALAIEDTVTNHAAATGAGLHCIFFPGEYAEVQDIFNKSDLTYHLLDKVSKFEDS